MLKKRAQLKGSVSAFDVLDTKLGDSKKSLQAANLELSSLKEQVARSDAEKSDSYRLIAEVREKSELHMIR